MCCDDRRPCSHSLLRLHSRRPQHVAAAGGAWHVLETGPLPAVVPGDVGFPQGCVDRPDPLYGCPASALRDGGPRARDSTPVNPQLRQFPRIAFRGGRAAWLTSGCHRGTPHGPSRFVQARCFASHQAADVFAHSTPTPAIPPTPDSGDHRDRRLASKRAVAATGRTVPCLAAKHPRIDVEASRSVAVPGDHHRSIRTSAAAGHQLLPVFAVRRSPESLPTSAARRIASRRSGECVERALPCDHSRPLASLTTT